jgi:hypothetical protein
MRRARRIIYNWVVGVSVLLFLGVVGIWVRSYWVSDEFTWRDWPPDRSFLVTRTIQISRGGLRLSSWRAEGTGWKLRTERHFLYSSQHAFEYPLWGNGGTGAWPLEYRPYITTLGFELIYEKGHIPLAGPWKSIAFSSLTLPLYFLTLLSAILPAHYLLRVRKRRRMASRRARGCCVSCGYDLRASPGRCPECGVVVVKAE